jgi:hypothetical protein
LPLLIYFAGSDAEDEGNNLSIVGLDKITVDIKKRESGQVPSSLVSIQKRVVANNSVEVSSG